LHVVAQAQKVSLRLPNGSVVRADVVSVDTGKDVAVLQTQSTEISPLPLEDSDTIQVGTDIVVIGFPLASHSRDWGIRGDRHEGIVSAIRTQSGMIQVDAAMNPGVSGGPVLTLDGKVVGFADASLRGAQSVNFAVPSKVVQIVISRVGTGTPALQLPLLTVQSIKLSYAARGPGHFDLTQYPGVRCVGLPANAVEIVSISSEIRTAPS
jgi:serine protease Do